MSDLDRLIANLTGAVMVGAATALFGAPAGWGEVCAFGALVVALRVGQRLRARRQQRGGE